MKYNEEENMLIDMVSDANEEIKDSLYNRYEELIYFYIKKYSSVATKLGIEYSELCQEVNLAFAGAISSYDSEKDANFKTFVNICLKRRIINLLRSAKTDKKIQDKKNLSLDYIYNEEGTSLKDVLPDNLADPSRKSLEKENLHELIAKITRQLSPTEQEIFNYMVDGLNKEQISAITDKSLKQVENTITRIIKKVRILMESESNA